MPVFDWVIREIYWIGGAIGTLAVFFKWGWPRMKRFGTLNMIAQQFSPNGGNSLRDVINRIEKTANEAKVTSAEALKVCHSQNETLAKILDAVTSK